MSRGAAAAATRIFRRDSRRRRGWDIGLDRRAPRYPRGGSSKDYKNARLIVFGLYKKECARLEKALASKGWVCAAIHGDLSQAARTAAFESFKGGSVPLLVATDVAARGLDIPDAAPRSRRSRAVPSTGPERAVAATDSSPLIDSRLSRCVAATLRTIRVAAAAPRRASTVPSPAQVELVVNYSFPLTIEDYVHRIGRTGRAGKTGLAHTFFHGDGHEKALAGALQNVLRGAGADVPAALLKFGSTVKKKEDKNYGAFGPKPGLAGKKATKIVFGD